MGNVTSDDRLRDAGYEDGFADGEAVGIALLLEPLRAAGFQFRDYERQHRAKGTFEADAKAEVNAQLAARCQAAVAEAEAIHPDAKPPNALHAILADMLAYEAEAFDARPVAFYVRTWRPVPDQHMVGVKTTTRGPYDTRDVAEATLAMIRQSDGSLAGMVEEEELGDLHVSGADLVDAFTEWRAQIREALHARRVVLADNAELIVDALKLGLSYVVDAEEEQASGVADGIYEEEEGEEISARQEKHRALIGAAIDALDPVTAAPHPAPLCIGVRIDGGLVEAVWADRPCPGVEVLVYDFDVEGGQDLMEIVEPGGGGDLVAYDVHSDLEVRPMPKVRNLESDGPS